MSDFERNNAHGGKFHGEPKPPLAVPSGEPSQTPSAPLDATEREILALLDTMITVADYLSDPRIGMTDPVSRREQASRARVLRAIKLRIQP